MIYEDYPCSFHISYKLLIFLAGPPLPLPQSSYTLTLIFLPISVFPFTWSLTCPLPLPWTVSLSIVASQKIFYIYSHPNTYPGQCLRLFQGSLFRNKIYDKIFMTLSRQNFKRCKEKILNKLNENQEKYGKRYCPCVPSYLYNTEDNVCLCKSFGHKVDFSQLM